ncbi:WD40 repeat-like protein [Aspergillus homomorphus CBS 101889]|uniref:WD40 repeat-like protein n=1 Tax=Aspergillus homomorphus (strain CBS 101889) TaxID=1450537 RepID=A0A395IB61_ASPHC|nr:WD40 repeat-like protein [Aspergillus homomorphus CBS 101889]RAL17437.1 WD40 repeat-like protein [Aspergillus homomorphus CBS 101889]
MILFNIEEDVQELVRISRRAEQRSLNADDQHWLKTLNATDPSLDKVRIEEAKGWLVRDSYSWVLDHVDFQTWKDSKDAQLLWIKGEPGKGKTMLLCGIIDELSRTAMHDTNIAYFFCQADRSYLDNATAVLRGLINMLGRQQPSLITHIRDGFFEGENAWYALLRAFTNILEDQHLQSTYIIIDALDECKTDLSRLLHVIVEKSSVCPHVKWLVSSRNWPDIERDLRGTAQLQLRLELNASTLSSAVEIFVQHRVKALADKHDYGPDMQNDVQHYLVSRASGTFLWVALICDQLTKTRKWNVMKRLEYFPPGLNELYKRMLNQISRSDDAEICKSILGVVASVYRPITLDELASCMDLPEEVREDEGTLVEVIELCGSFLTLRGRTITLVHQSAKDFLIGDAVDEIFPDKQQESVHSSICFKSLQVIQTLRRDIYGLVAPGYAIDRVRQPDPDPLVAARYACVYWVDHLAKCSPRQLAQMNFQDNGPIGMFFCQDYLHWLEALSLLGSLTQGVASILKLENLLKATATANPELVSRVQDAKRFILYHKIAIENHPLQVYSSGLIFSPVQSITRCRFQTQVPDWVVVKPKMEESWSLCLQTLEGHSDDVTSVVFSHDSKLLASSSEDRTMKLWDPSTGKCLQTLEGHKDGVNSAAFSHDSKILASSSEDRTIKLWDTSSGNCLQTLHHKSRVFSARFSHDSKLLVSVVFTGELSLWDARSGHCLEVLCGRGCHNSFTFSHDSKLLAYASGSTTLNIFDTVEMRSFNILEGHGGRVHSVAFSHDSKLLASAAGDHTIKIWDTSTFKCLQTLEYFSGYKPHVIFSYDSKLLLLASNVLGAISIWDPATGQCLQTLDDHSGRTGSICFSTDSALLASGSKHTVRIWDSGTRQSSQNLETDDATVYTLVFSPDAMMLASRTSGSVKLWDTNSGQWLHTLGMTNGSVNILVFSRDSKLLAYYFQNTINLWDTSSGECRTTLDGHFSDVVSIAFSHDSGILASGSDYEEGKIKLWDTGTGRCLQTLEDRGFPVTSVAFSHDSKLLVSGSFFHIGLIVWDTSSGKRLQTLKGHRLGCIESLAFSSDSKLLASYAADHSISLWDTDTWQCLQVLDGQGISSIHFDISDPCLLLTNRGSIRVPLVVENESPQGVPVVPQFQALGVSLDGSWIKWCSENLLWLPPEYRPYVVTVAASQSAIAIGCRSGLVFILRIDAQKLLQYLAGD